MAGPAHQTEDEVHEATHMLVEIAEQVEREREERRERTEGFGKGIKIFGLDAGDREPEPRADKATKAKQVRRGGRKL